MATERIEELRKEAADAIGAASTTAELEELRVRYLGRKADLTQILRGISDLPAKKRGPVGKSGNEARQELESLIEARSAELDASELGTRLAEDAIDVTLPGAPPVPVGAQNPLLRTQREIEDIFVGLGYRVMEGPEVELDYYNFTALNHPPGHPARMAQDTFYVGDDVVLRTHTSPMQIRAMEAQPPPIYIVVPGRVYRPDNDATHTPQFHQVEGLAVDEGLTLGDLQGTLLAFAQAIFGDDRKVRLRPHFFPFTEPSVEVDVSCFNCARDGSPCRVCKGEGWVEILGAGMVDPNLYSYVRGYDPEEVSGFAFGLGVERVAGLRHDIPDIRLLWENDLRFMEQFG